jgi:hypothetical protein
VIVLDATAIDDPVTRDEMLALAIFYAEPDDTLTIHKPRCPAEASLNADCTCLPTTLRLGAKA